MLPKAISHTTVFMVLKEPVLSLCSSPGEVTANKLTPVVLYAILFVFLCDHAGTTVAVKDFLSHSFIHTFNHGRV